MDITPQLPCGHEYCKSCMAQLREKRVAQTCPLCRKALPPGPDKLYDLGWRIYMKIRVVVDSDWKAVSWEHISLSPAQQEGMDQARALMLEAAAQGQVAAQTVCGFMYLFARGVAKDERLAFVYYEKAAGQGNTTAMASIGSLYCNGMGVPQDYKRGFELFQQSRALGNTDPVLQLNLGICYKHGIGVAKDYLEARRLCTMASAQGYAPGTKHLTLLDESIRTECPLLGKRVVITSTSREDLNGRTEVATSFDHDRHRYVVKLRTPRGYMPKD